MFGLPTETSAQRSYCGVLSTISRDAFFVVRQHAQMTLEALEPLKKRGRTALTQMLQGELDTLGYPRAALFGFGVALATYNILSSVQVALQAKFGTEKIQEEVSAFYIALKVQASHQGMEIVFEPEVWVDFPKLSPKALLRWAAHVTLTKYRRHPRGPKKPVPKRTRFVDKMPVSTARLLAKSRMKSP